MTNILNGNLAVRVCERTDTMQWQASPSGTVWRKRLHLVGPKEAGQVTSVVRYDEGARFPNHEHPDGEEIFVLEGVLSDDHGEWPAGSYILNPEGVSHAPSSYPGCVVFVKLRQYPGLKRRHVAVDTKELAWRQSELKGIEEKLLYKQEGFSDTTALQRWNNAIGGQTLSYPEGAEIFVIQGSFADEFGCYGAGDWLRLPFEFKHSPTTTSGCELYLKKGGLVYLQSA